jgi:hypothetical protein
MTAETNTLEPLEALLNQLATAAERLRVLNRSPLAGKWALLDLTNARADMARICRKVADRCER